MHNGHSVGWNAKVLQQCCIHAGDESVALGQHDLAAAAGLPPQMQLRGLAPGLMAHDDSASLSETLDHNVEVAAVQNSLANMSMPQPRQESPAPESRLRSPQGAIPLVLMPASNAVRLQFSPASRLRSPQGAFAHVVKPASNAVRLQLYHPLRRDQ